MQKNIIAIFSFLSLSIGASAVWADEAATVGSASSGGGIQSLIMFGALFVMMYFLMIRPQSKRAKEQRNMLANITKGDEVLTQGGLVGTIARDAGTFFMLTVSEGVEIPVQKQAVTQLLPKGTLKSI